jgi:hypothetical protein
MPSAQIDADEKKSRKLCHLPAGHDSSVFAFRLIRFATVQPSPAGFAYPADLQ